MKKEDAYIIKIMEDLKAHCDGRKCEECVFGSCWYECVLKHTIPQYWELDEDWLERMGFNNG